VKQVSAMRGGAGAHRAAARGDGEERAWAPCHRSDGGGAGEVADRAWLWLHACAAL